MAETGVNNTGITMDVWLEKFCESHEYDIDEIGDTVRDFMYEFAIWYAGRASAPAAAQGAPDETGWLIEKGQLCLGSSCGKPAWVTFTDPSAVRFARKIDAENMLLSLRGMSDEGAFRSCTINDHMWCTALPSSPVSRKAVELQNDDRNT